MSGSAFSSSAAELEILQTPPPESGKGYIVDDGGLLSRAASGTINSKLAALEKETGFHLNVITIRKLVFEQDPSPLATRFWKHGILLLKLATTRATFFS